MKWTQRVEERPVNQLVTDNPGARKDIFQAFI